MRVCVKALQAAGSGGVLGRIITVALRAAVTVSTVTVSQHGIVKAF